MDNSGSARVADFGLAMVTQNLDSARSTSCQRGHTARWAAPELLSEGTFSKGTDIFSFAMVMTEVRHRLSTSSMWSFGPLIFRIDTGIHRRDSIQRRFIFHGYFGHNPMQAPATTDTSNLHRKFVDAGATVLGPPSSPTPGSFGSFASSSHSVSSPFRQSYIH